MGDGDKTSVLKDTRETLNIELEKAKKEEACFIIIRGQPQGKRYILSKDQMFLGRDPSADLSVNDANISRKHAEIVRRNDVIFLKDLDSTNGTFINDKRLHGEAELKKEDMIKVGNTILKYLPRGELETYYMGTLETAAHTDALTKTFNKGYIMEALETEFKRAKALHHEFSLLILDLDHFKKVNDTHGHDAGDMVLREVANLVKSKVLPSHALFGRFGGEEFLILLPKTSGEAAAELAEKLRAQMEATHFNYEGKRIPVTASIGVTEMSLEIESATMLFKTADKAVYKAKNQGRNQVCVER